MPSSLTSKLTGCRQSLSVHHVYNFSEWVMYEMQVGEENVVSIRLLSDNIRRIVPLLDTETWFDTKMTGVFPRYVFEIKLTLL